MGQPGIVEDRSTGRLPRPEDLARPGATASRWWRGVALGALSLALALGLLAAIWLLARPLALLLAAIVIAQALSPAVGWLERRLPRPVAIGLVYLALLLVLAALVGLVVPSLVSQAQELIDNGPRLLERGRAWLDRWRWLGVDRLTGALGSNSGQTGTALVTVPVKVLASAVELILILAMSAYWLAAMPRLHRFALSLVPEGRRPRAAALLHEVGHTMGGYVRGVAIDALVVGLAVSLGLTLIGVDYPLVLALIAALGEFVPVVGPIAASVPAIVIALLDSPFKALLVLAFYAVVQLAESYLLLPNVMRTQSDIPPLLVLFALAAGGAIGGILGALVAIPLAGAIQVLVVRVLAPSVRRWTGAPDPDEEGTEEEAGS